MSHAARTMRRNWLKVLGVLIAAVACAAALTIAPVAALAADGELAQGSSGALTVQSTGLSLNEETTVTGVLVRHEARGSYGADGGDSNIVYYVVELDEPAYEVGAGSQYPITIVQVKRLISGARSSTPLVPFSEMEDSQLEPLLGSRVTATGTLFMSGALYMYSEYQLRDPIVTAAEEPLPDGAQRMRRLYNPNSYEHFYTADEEEFDNLVSIGWLSEEYGWIAPATGTPVYRLYNPNDGGDHHYTKDAEERDMLVSVGWLYEDVGWYSADESGVPVYREYNPNEPSRNHNYTADKSEHDSLCSIGWRDEDIAWYGVGSFNEAGEAVVTVETSHYRVQVPKGWSQALGGALTYEVDEDLALVDDSEELGYGCVSAFHIASGTIHVACFTDNWGPQGSYAYKKIGSSLSLPGWSVYAYTYHDYSLEGDAADDASEYLDEFAAFVTARETPIDEPYFDGLAKDGP